MTPSSTPGPAASAPDSKPRVRLFYWSVRREIWEHRSLYRAPLSVAAVFLLGFVISLGGLAHRRRALMSLAGAKQASTVALPYHIAAVAVIATTVVVGAVYCLGALHNERRDRSILFWKSLPVSDVTTVLSKAFVPLAVLPAIAFVVTVALQIVMLLLSGAVLAVAGLASTPATQLPLLEMTGVLFYGLCAFSLWWAPLYGWLLLVSSWAKRVPVLWAILPPIALCLVEQIALESRELANLLGHRLGGGYAEAFLTKTDRVFHPGLALASSKVLSQPDPARFASSPGLWAGLLVAAVFLAGAVWLRRRQAPI